MPWLDGPPTGPWHLSCDGCHRTTLCSFWGFKTARTWAGVSREAVKDPLTGDKIGTSYFCPVCQWGAMEAHLAEQWSLPKLESGTAPVGMNLSLPESNQCTRVVSRHHQAQMPLPPPCAGCQSCPCICRSYKSHGGVKSPYFTYWPDCAGGAGGGGASRKSPWWHFEKPAVQSADDPAVQTAAGSCAGGSGAGGSGGEPAADGDSGAN